MVPVTSASGYITSAPRYHPRYQSRSSIYMRGLIPQNFANWPGQFQLKGSGEYARRRSIVRVYAACRFIFLFRVALGKCIRSGSTCMFFEFQSSFGPAFIMFI